MSKVQNSTHQQQNTRKLTVSSTLTSYSCSACMPHHHLHYLICACTSTKGCCFDLNRDHFQEKLQLNNHHPSEVLEVHHPGE
ncbi:Os07g0176401 [Oryza sativa Japonica Group]|uniref:Os07g0176401 protein n=1 Tax=Oryza sativa subsp. japonica TaxID=39947 RepID=A0A0P0X2R0_ORYSJ|nr:hypothetical protein EE612_037445 [Oryza sativa]BAT00287.1 Os07g0176401 [Oryza sativa Japonica Group]